VVVSQVQPVAGNHLLVPAPELQVINTLWHVSLNQSLVTFLILNITTVGPASGFKVYQVFVEVSCLNLSTNVTYTCSQGSGMIPLPTNMNGASAVLLVPLSPPVDPETAEIHDLSFITTSTSLPNSPGVVTVTNPSTPTLNSNGTATVTVTLHSVNGYAGVVTLAPQPAPGLTVLPGVQNITLQSGGTATATLTIHDAPLTLYQEILPFIIHLVAPEFPPPEWFIVVTNPAAFANPVTGLIGVGGLNG
jgi:hypothetical protein